MQILLTAKLIIEEFLSYIFILVILISASFCVMSRRILNSILWFNAASMAIFGFLIGEGVPVVGIVVVMASVFLSASLLLMNSCYGEVEQKKKAYNTSSVYACLGITVVTITFAAIRSSDIVIQVAHKTYDSTMYIITALFSVISLIIVFGTRVFLIRDFKNL